MSSSMKEKDKPKQQKTEPIKPKKTTPQPLKDPEKGKRYA